MNADMTHCRGEHCMLQDECYRYWLHKHSKARIARYFTTEPYDKKTNECRHFIENEKK